MKRFFLIFATTSLLCISCKKEKDTLAIIRVVDTNNIVVQDATVILFGNPQSSLGTVERIDSLKTNQNGEAVFNYTELFKLGQAGFATLDIYASKGNLTGTGLLKIEEEKTAEKTIKIEL